MPSAESTIDESTGNVFTDSIKSIKKWLLGLPGVNYLYMAVSSPYNLLKGVFHNHPEMAFALGTVWWGITIFLIISFIWGRE